MAETRSVRDIAAEIEDDWSKQKGGVNYAAKPYLDAMYFLETVKDSFFMDSGKSIVLYFLANAGTWRGDVARRVKVELKALVK